MRLVTLWLFALQALCAGQGFAQASRDFSPITGFVYAVANITSKALMSCGAHYGAGVCLVDWPFAACADGSELRVLSYQYCTVYPLPEGYCYVYVCAGDPALNVALGGKAGQALEWDPENFTGAFGNTAIGSFALSTSVSGRYDVAVGVYALTQVNNFNSGVNVAVGPYALMSLQQGGNNVAVGGRAGLGLVSGSDNLYLANGAPSGDTESATIRIGDPFYQSRAFIAGIRNTTLSVDPQPVYIDANGQLGLFAPPAGAERPTAGREAGLGGAGVPRLERRMEAQEERIARLERELREQAAELEALSLRLAAVASRPAAVDAPQPPPRLRLRLFGRSRGDQRRSGEVRRPGGRGEGS